MVLDLLERECLFAREERRKLVDRLPRDQDLRHVLHTQGAFAASVGEAMPVRRDHGNTARLENEERTRKVVPRILRSDRERGLRDEVPYGLGGELRSFSALRVRELGKVLFGK